LTGLGFQSVFGETDEKIASLCPDHSKSVQFAIFMGEDFGHYAGYAIHSCHTCLMLERAYMQIALDWANGHQHSGHVQTVDAWPGGFLHVTEPSSHHCLTNQWIACGDGATCWFSLQPNPC